MTTAPPKKPSKKPKIERKKKKVEKRHSREGKGERTSVSRESDKWKTRGKKGGEGRARKDEEQKRPLGPALYRPDSTEKNGDRRR